MAWPKPGRKSKQKRPGSRRCLPNVSCGVCSRRKRRIGKHGVYAINFILVGGTGTGKTHLATALGVAAIQQGKRIRFFNAVDLVNRLEQEKQQDKAGTLARKLIRVDAVILDELGYLPFPESGGAVLFHLISQLYERPSLI
jgi:DNA replication protein DnaC